MPDDESEAASALLTAHLLRHLASYRGSLALAIDAIDNGWLPAEDDARIGILARFMAPEEHLSKDSFLLRVGLVVPGLQRGVRPPLLVLSESRGGLSKRRLEEAAAQVARLAEALAIGRAFRPGHSSSNEQATRELLALLAEKRDDLLVNDVARYVHLTPTDVIRLAAAGLAFLRNDVQEIRTIGADLLQRLACFRFQPLEQETLTAILSRNLLWPASIYRDAPDEIADQLLEKFDSSIPTVVVNQLLSALAWTRSEKARKAFNAWVESPPPWGSRISVPPGDFLQTAGWSVDAQGNRRDLASMTCFQLLPAEEGSIDPATCFALADGKCPTCRTALRWLFAFPRVDVARLGTAWLAAPSRVLTCLVCARYAAVFADYTDTGASLHRPVTEAERPEDEWLPEPSTRTVSSSPFPPFACAEPFSVEDASTLGGVPMWVQDADYPRCPRCRLEMLFLAQFDNSSLNEEGIYYAFFCGACRVSAVTYQQT